MTDSKSIYSDNEYTIMSEIMDKESITQRELSKKLGISVSTVNVLMNKMIRDGLVKMTQVSQKQVLYMLTPVGIIEKTKKTMSYLRIHYRAIYETKEKIKAVFEELEKEYDAIFVLTNDDEMGEIIKMALHELGANHIKTRIVLVDKDKSIDFKGFKLPVLVHMVEDPEVIQKFVETEGLTVINLAERL